jgi:hypothetical protein
MTRRARNWTIAALIGLVLPAACAYSFYRLTRTDPIDSPIVQAFLIDDDGSRPRQVLGPDVEPQQITDERLNALQGRAFSEGRELVEDAGFYCHILENDARTLYCVREFHTVAGACFWKLYLRRDGQDRVDSMTATRWGHCPHY